MTTPEPAPKPGREVVYEALFKDFQDRVKFGIDKYGQPLMTHDGRDTMIDLYQELIDAVFYIKKLMMERDDSTLLSQLVEILGWQGGTASQVLEEVLLLVELRKSLYNRAD